MNIRDNKDVVIVPYEEIEPLIDEIYEEYKELFEALKDA